MPTGGRHLKNLKRNLSKTHVNVVYPSHPEGTHSLYEGNAERANRRANGSLQDNKGRLHFCEIITNDEQ